MAQEWSGLAQVGKRFSSSSCRQFVGARETACDLWATRATIGERVTYYEDLFDCEHPGAPHNPYRKKETTDE